HIGKIQSICDEMNETKIRTRMLLSEVERLISVHKILVPCPSRQTLIRMCEDGTFDARRLPNRRNWYVYADSFWRWAKGESQST
ncbi:hypothetical protein OFC37_30785, partial [Escherichia coli]|nr:hypothetical protein [Escherichia coli]